MQKYNHYATHHPKLTPDSLEECMYRAAHSECHAVAISDSPFFQVSAYCSPNFEDMCTNADVRFP
jgi:hypothetical protein